MADKKPCILVVTGPTATGKTAVAVSVCKIINGEIVSADSMQIYKHMTIGTAKPTPNELDEVKCHLIDYIEPDDSFNVFRYKTDAVSAIDNIIANNHIPVLCGGTGLYIDTVLKNTELSQDSNDDSVRSRLLSDAADKGNDYLYKQLVEVDNITASRIHPNDTKRLVRALEIYITTGKTQSYWDEESKKTERLYESFCVLLTYRNRDLLYDRINKRVDAMAESGLIDEAKYIYDNYDTRKISAIGYPELFSYFDGKFTLDDALDKIKQYSRNYAKRQLTWFRKVNFNQTFYMDELNFDEVVSDISHSFLSFSK